MITYLNLQDGYYKCKVCNKISPLQSMVKHSKSCDNYDIDEDIKPFDKEVQKLLDLKDILHYYQNKKDVSDLAHRRRNNVNVMSTFPYIMIKRIEDQIKEQTKIVKILDTKLHSMPSLEATEIRTIKDCVPLKRIENLELY